VHALAFVEGRPGANAADQVHVFLDIGVDRRPLILIGLFPQDAAGVAVGNTILIVGLQARLEFTL